MPNRRMPGRRSIAAAAICAGLLLAFAIISLRAASTKSFTVDEPLHLVTSWIEYYHRDFRGDPQDPPLWKNLAVGGNRAGDLFVDLKNPLWQAIPDHPDLITQFSGDMLFSIPWNNADALLTNARSRMVWVGALIGLLIAWWAWRLAGPLAAVTATLFFTFDPNFLAHAPLVKNDVSIVLAFLALIMAAWSAGRRVTWFNIASLGLAIGAAVTIKFSGLGMAPLACTLLFVRSLLPQAWIVLGREIHSRRRRIGIAALLCVYMACAAYVSIWANYGFRFYATPEANVRLDTKNLMTAIAACSIAAAHPDQTPTAQQIDQWRPGLAVRGAMWADQHQLLPEPYLVGFLDTYAGSQLRNAYLMGNYSSTGWWYYFPLAMIFKTPLATLAGILAALLVALGPAQSSLRRMLRSNPWPPICLLTPLLWYGSLALRSHVDLGIRHVLSFYPFIYVLLGCAVAAAYRWRPRATAVIAAALFVGLAAETAAAFPDYIAFFNAAAGGSRGGIRLLGDSNLDWGQDLKLLAAWQKQNPREHLFLNYFGGAYAEYYGIRFTDLSGRPAPADQIQWPTGPGVLAVSATEIQGIYSDDIMRSQYLALLKVRPLAILGGSIYLYRINSQLRAVDAIP